VTTTDPSFTTGSFTLPGEAGYERLTLDLAKKWGADTIRDSDGTQLSPEILGAGYQIYSTICLVRSVNPWARQNLDKLQQNFLMSFPLTAAGLSLTIDLLAGYYREQFVVNILDDPKLWWQVFDRTTGEEVPSSQWDCDAKTATVTIHDTRPSHRYTVNFLAWRIWEEISMYNHITNGWGDREHLMAVDPIHPETQTELLAFLDRWLAEHPDTDVVRFTSLFYNFTWFWGSDPNLRYIYSDWGDYAMTVSPAALRLFAKANGYTLTSEDFVNAGHYNCTHNAPSRRYLDYVDFMHNFVVDFGRECVRRVHAAGKQAYVFYDDHWIGVEPYGRRFHELEFDGIIKCVFSAFEARKCAGVKGVPVHELRLHPYLFPTGLKAEPTFAPGGNPTLDAKKFWIDTRRALLRAPVDRIGLGGYLHLVEPFPDFCDYIEGLTREFRLIKSFHKGGGPYVAPFKVAILTAWGSLRSWIASGHFTRGLEYNELIESLAGLPIDVDFISFDDLLECGIPGDVKVVINCGREGSAWSGGYFWKYTRVIELLTDWVNKGGGFIGIAEPSALRREHIGNLFQLASILGVDRDLGALIGHGKYAFKQSAGHFITADLPGEPDFGKDVDNIHALDAATEVLSQKDNSPRITARTVGQGRSVYFSGFKFAPPNTRLIHRAIAWAASHEHDFAHWTCSNIETECAWYPASRKVVVINNSGEPQQTEVFDDQKRPHSVTLDPHGIQIIELSN
jgi:beta-D-galactosyl-(1->4)-L-rhamnose phosphorylase